MNILKRLFHRRKKADGNEPQKNGAARGNRGAESALEVEELQRSVVGLCEQMVDLSRDLDEVKQEYQVVTSYLNDIQMLEEMSEEMKAPIVECASRVSALDRERTEFLKTERRLSDTQFAQMQEAEDELPDIIRRLSGNESDLDKIKKDLSRLEGEKLEWAMQKSESERQQKILRKMSVYLLVIYPTLLALFLLLFFLMEKKIRIPVMVSTALAAAIGVYIFVKYQDATQDIGQAQANRNKAITLENHVKIKYVNIKNAVDYTCEKYHVRDSRDLTYLYEQYQEELKEKEKLRRTSDDLEYYRSQLVRLLREKRLYDAQVWTGHANAIIDSREMVELKHELITRRQKLRAQIEYNVNTIADIKKEALRHVAAMEKDGLAVRPIIKKIEDISASL